MAFSGLQKTRLGLIAIARSLYGSFAGKAVAADLLGEDLLSLIDEAKNGILSPILQIGLSSVISVTAIGLLSTIDDAKTGIESEIS